MENLPGKLDFVGVVPASLGVLAAVVGAVEDLMDGLVVHALEGCPPAAEETRGVHRDLVTGSLHKSLQDVNGLIGSDVIGLDTDGLGVVLVPDAGGPRVCRRWKMRNISKSLRHLDMIVWVMLM